MSTNRNSLAVLVAIIACSILVWLSASIHGGQKTYEIHPNLSIPEYKTDLARVMDAYERLMERYLDLTEQNQTMIGADLKYVAATLDSIDGRLADLSARMSRIETALGIDRPKSPPAPQPIPQP